MAGGAGLTVLATGGQRALKNPSFTPGGEAVVFVAMSAGDRPGESTQQYSQDPNGGFQRHLWEGSRNAAGGAVRLGMSPINAAYQTGLGLGEGIVNAGNGIVQSGQDAWNGLSGGVNTAGQGLGTGAGQIANGDYLQGLGTMGGGLLQGTGQVLGGLGQGALGLGETAIGGGLKSAWDWATPW